MKICVFGLGAIGGLLASRLAHNEGIQFSAIARGPHLAAVQERGLTVLESGGRRVARFAASDRPEAFGPQDLVLNCLKAHDAWQAAADMAPLLGPETAVVTCQNGLPWWYFDDLEGSWKGTRLSSLDAGDRQRNAIGANRIIGCCIYPAAEIVEPGVIRHRFGQRFEFGEPSGTLTTRVAAVVQALEGSGLQASTTEDIRSAIWMKLLGNLGFNPISVLTRATVDVMTADPGTRAIGRALMLEGQAVGERVGARFRVSVEDRINQVQRVGAHRMSMLQDFEAGKPMEIAPIMGAVQEIGEIVGVRTPCNDAMLSLVRQLAESQRIGAGRDDKHRPERST